MASLSRYTIFYALTRDLGVPQHECYHHAARVTAPTLEDAIARCRQDALPGFTFHVLAAVDGIPELLAVECLVHTLGVDET
jgi:hypothetical protein